MQALVRDAQKRAAEKRLESLLMEGINSGPSIPVDENYWDAKRERALARHNSDKR